MSKSCQKVAIFFKKVAEKLLNFQKVAEKLPKFFCFLCLFWVLKIKNSHIAILALSGVRRLAPSLLAFAIGLLGPSSADSSELDVHVLESL